MSAKKSKTVKKPVKKSVKKPLAKKVTKKEDPLRKARKEVKRLNAENKELREVLAETCDLALDAADMVEDSGFDLDEESDDFRDRVMNRRELSGLPEDERHVERRKEREEKRRVEEERKQARLEHRKVSTSPVPEATENAPEDVLPDGVESVDPEPEDVLPETDDFADVPVETEPAP